MVAPAPGDFRRWNNTLKSVALRNGLRQLLRHEESGSAASGGNSGGSGSGGDLSPLTMVQRLMELEHVEVVACRGLRVAFAVDELSREGVHRPPGVPVEAELRVFQVAARAGETECRG